jgi:hypothetical protein
MQDDEGDVREEWDTVYPTQIGFRWRMDGAAHPTFEEEVQRIAQVLFRPDIPRWRRKWQPLLI